MDVIPAVVFFSLLVASVFLVFSFISPLLTSAERTEPAWQVIKTGNVINFREAVYLIPVDVEVSSNCSYSGVFRLWYVFPNHPGALKEVKGTLEAVFERNFGEPVGSWVAAARLYEVQYIVATFTDIESATEVIYGGPVRIEVVKVEEITITPAAGRACSLCVAVQGSCIYQADGVYIKIYNRAAAVR